MNVNPEDYDIDELRQMAAERHTETRSPQHGREEADKADSRNGQRSESRNGHASGMRNGHRRGARDHPSSDSFSRPLSSHEAAPYDAPPRRNPSPRRGVAADALRSNQLEQLFLHQSSLAPEQMTKPYLSGLPQKYAAERVVFDWLEFLVLKGGFKGTMDALRYYKTIDWITDDVEARLQDYLIGFTDDGSGSRPLEVDDHQLSLLYVARLASMN